VAGWCEFHRLDLHQTIRFVLRGLTQGEYPYTDTMMGTLESITMSAQRNVTLASTATGPTAELLAALFAEMIFRTPSLATKGEDGCLSVPGFFSLSKSKSKAIANLNRR